MKHFGIFLLLSVCAAVAAFSSCEERIRLDDNGKSLILNAMLTTGDTLQRAFVSYGTIDEVLPVEDCSLECYVNDTLRSTGSLEVIDGRNKGVSFEASIRPGDKVRLVASTTEGFRAEAVATAPQPPIITSALIDTVSVLLPGKDKVYDYPRIRTKVHDIKGKDNWYRIKMMRRSKTILTDIGEYSEFKPEEVGTPVLSSTGNVRFSNWMEPLLNNGLSLSKGDDQSETNYFANNLNIFSDKDFRDGECELTLLVQNGVFYDLISLPITGGDEFCMKCDIVVRLSSMDRDTFNYLNAAQFEMSDASSTYLTDQYPFPSNVKGGLGYVCIFSDCEYLVSLPDRIRKY
ncbi:MAG: DUF4249 family protein [Candidatus Cryptobacteroides sp.]